MTNIPPAADEPRRGIWLTALLALLLGFASISTDFYLPALPAMGISLGADQGSLELTVTAYLLGFSLGQLFWGPVSDKFGRKVPLLLGIAIFILGAAGCAFATNVWQLIGFRIVQALGASAAVVLARAMVRDLFKRDEAARVLSTLMMIMGPAPIIGPIVGGQILAFANWQAIFWTLVAVGLVTLIGIARTDEALPREKRVSGSLFEAFASYGGHLRNRRLLAYAGLLACYTGATFAYVAGSPFVFIEYFSLSPQLYGFVFATGIVGIVSANAANRRLIPRMGSDRLMVIGTLIGAFSGLAYLVMAVTGFGGLAGIGLALFITVTMIGLVVANAIAGGLNTVETGTGSASALLGAAQYGGGMIGSALVGAFANGTPVPMAVIITVGAGAAFGCATILTGGASQTRGELVGTK